MKTIILGGLALVLIIGGAYFFTQTSIFTGEEKPEPVAPVVVTPPATSTPVVSTTTPPVTEAKDLTKTVIGSSVGEHDIMAYHYGTGTKEILFVGGIHGGYEWNSALVAFELMNYLDKNPAAIPAGVKVTVIPVLNPDGLALVTDGTGVFTKADVTASAETKIAGRFNGNTVDLNRNFDCDWKASGTWQNKAVSGGTKVFSEPEAQALRDYVTGHTITAAVVWFSAAGGVYASNCDGPALPETQTLTALFAKAAGYTPHASFDSYEITGDAVNWLAKMKIPAISVLLTTHEDTEWAKNKAGIDALLAHYAK